MNTICSSLLEATRAVLAVYPATFEVTGYDGDGETFCLYCGGPQVTTTKAVAYAKATHQWRRHNPKPYVDAAKRRQELEVTDFLGKSRAVELAQRQAMREAQDAEKAWRRRYEAFSLPREPKEGEWQKLQHRNDCVWLRLKHIADSVVP